MGNLFLLPHLIWSTATFCALTSHSIKLDKNSFFQFTLQLPTYKPVRRKSCYLILHLEPEKVEMQMDRYTDEENIIPSLAWRVLAACHHQCKCQTGRKRVTKYSRTSVARTLMARLPQLFLTRSRVPWNKNHSSRFGII